MSRVSIVIPTYRRPSALRRTLDSCLAQRGLPDGCCEIVVVDNCPDGSAAALLSESPPAGAPPIRYVAEPRPGVSHARNAGVAAAAGELIAFIDDDEVADPDWLAALLAAQSRFDADVVFGLVRGRLEEPCRFDRAFVEAFYSRDAGRATGPIEEFFGTGNSLLRRASCLDGSEPFDPRVSLTGGEDDLLFARLARAGRRFVWCREAVVDELIPPQRAEPAYIWQRSFHRGQGPSVLCARAEPRDWAGVARWMAIGCGQAAIYGTAAAALWLLRPAAAPRMTGRAIEGLGKLFWMRPFRPRLYAGGR